MAKYIITLEDNAHGVVITGNAILTKVELSEGITRTPSIALGGLVLLTAGDWIMQMDKKTAPCVTNNSGDTALNPTTH